MNAWWPFTFSHSLTSQPGLDNPARWVPILKNRWAGPRDRDGVLEELAQRLRWAGLMPELFTERHLYREAVTDPERIPECLCQVAGGGDGTIAWVLNTQPDLPIALIPLGGENLVAKHLRITRSAARVANMILAQRLLQLDLGQVNGRYFSVMASVGFDADIIEHVHRRRHGHLNKLHYIWTVAGRLYAHRPPALKVWADGEEIPGTVAHAYVFNLPRYALNLQFCPQALGQDGRLDLVLFRRPGQWHLLRYFTAVAGGWAHRLKDVEHRRIQSARIELAEPLSSPESARQAVVRNDFVQSDGDPAGNLPVEIAVAPARWQVLVPVEYQHAPVTDWPIQIQTGSAGKDTLLGAEPPPRPATSQVVPTDDPSRANQPGSLRTPSALVRSLAQAS